MRKKRANNTSVRWTSKNRCYLERLGMIDKQTGRAARRLRVNLNRFINEAISWVCECRGGGNHALSNDELKNAYVRFRIGSNASRIIELQKQSELLFAQLPKESPAPEKPIVVQS